MAPKIITNIKEYIRAFKLNKSSKLYNPKNIKKTETESSPSGKYELKIETFDTGKETWDVTRGTVTNKSGQTIAVIDRNYSHFWRCWVEDHPDGYDYLLCGENYQGQTIVRLDQPERRDYLPDSAQRGMGFCWADVKHSPDKKVIAVEGCYWACPYEIMLYDFSDPLSQPKSIDFNIDGHFDQIFGWKDNDTVILGYEEEFRKSDGVRIYDLEDEEEEKAYSEDDIDYRYIKKEFKVR